MAHNCLEQIEIGPGDDILIIGAGAIGCLAANICKALGCSKVIVTDIIESRLELAKSMGADVTINGLKENLDERIFEMTDNNGIGKILECSGVSSMLTGCLKYLRKGGYLGLIGLPKCDIVFKNPLHDVIFKSLTIKSVHGRRIFHTWEECEKLISDGKCNPEKCVTHEYPMDKYEDALVCCSQEKRAKLLSKLTRTN